MKRTWLLVVAGLLCATDSRSAKYYVAPSGISTGDGSINKPWNLATAMARGTLITAGDTVWLRGGTYGKGTNVYECRLTNTNGSLGNPVTFRQYPGERAIIDGGIYSYAPYIVFRDFEITCSTTSRTNTPTRRPGGLNMQGTANKAINLVIHDTGHPGIGVWYGAVDGSGVEIYGCIIWNIGLYDTNSTAGVATIRGSGIYMQNQNGNPLVSDVITFKNFTTGMKAYTQGGSANGFRWQGNVAFYDNTDSGLFVASFDNPATDIVVSSNYTFDCMFSEFGHYDGCPEMHDITLIGNYFVGMSTLAAAVHKVDSLLVTNNTFISVVSVSNYDLTAIFSLIPATNIVSSVVDYNNYWGGGKYIYFGSPVPFRFNSLVSSWSQWHTNGLDANSTYTTNLPTTNVVVVRTNKYERGRAHIIVYNWESNSVVNVDISGIGLSQGQRFEVRDVQNYFGTPALKGTYDPASPSITVPLTLTNCAVFVGTQTHMLHDPNVHTPSLFNTFVIMPSGKALLPPIGFHVRL